MALCRPGGSASAPAVSVLVPTYDRACFIGAAVESVLAQRFTNFEVIVVDDGSTDETAAILARVGDPRLRVLRREHGGIGKALNAGLSVARGRYIARNDSDDLWLPDHLASTLPALDADPTLDLVYGRAEFIDAEGAPLPGGRGEPLRHPGDPLRSLLHTDYTASVSSVMRRTAIERAGGWDESFATSEDWEMALRIALHGSVRFIDQVVARIRRHDGNATMAPSHVARALSDRLRIVERILRDPAAPPALRALAPRFRRDVYIGTALQYVELGQLADALRTLRATMGVGDNPVRTCARIVWCCVSWTVIARHAWSRDLAQRLARRWRRASSQEGGNRPEPRAIT
jgi:GT2 family glycosyltransferase